MRKYQENSDTQILREINWKPRGLKTAILALLKTKNFDVDSFVQILNAESYQNQNSVSLNLQ